MTSQHKIQTYSGHLVDPLNMSPIEVHLLDIAHGLSNICRFTGHASRFYSVLEHSINVANVAEWLMRDKLFMNATRKQIKLAAALHDASEAYLNDVCRPLKQHSKFYFYLETESKLQTMIYQKYLAQAPPDSALEIVNQADNIMLGIEARDLMALRPPEGKNGKESKTKVSTGAQRAWHETWDRYVSLIPEELKHISVVDPPMFDRHGNRIGAGFDDHFRNMRSTWLALCAPGKDVK